MKYLLLYPGAGGWDMFHTREELEKKLSIFGEGAKFTPHIPKGCRYLDSISRTIVPIADDDCKCIVPDMTEVETVAKTKQWVLPAEPKPESKWRRATAADIGEYVAPFAARNESIAQLGPHGYGTFRFVAMDRGMFVVADAKGNYSSHVDCWVHK